MASDGLSFDYPGCSASGPKTLYIKHYKKIIWKKDVDLTLSNPIPQLHISVMLDAIMVSKVTR